MPKIKKQSNMGKYFPTETEMKAAIWCFQNGVRISPIKKSYTEDMWYLEILLNKKKHKSPEAYGSVVIWQKMYEFYLYYYNKLSTK